MEEMVALYDEHGQPCGSAPRSRMRAENLRHAATAVVVRDPWGRVYVHRRTDTKDVYPSRRDFAAGGVIGAGEDPREAAVRELAEELGITDAPLVALSPGFYADDHTRYHGFCFTAEWDGPIRWQPEEVASGGWMTLEDLVAAVENDPDDFMPDTVGLLGGWLAERLGDRFEPEQGWDNQTVIVEGRWVDRRPRRPEAVAPLRREAQILPRLADRLPLIVPRPVLLSEDPLWVRHALVPGRSADSDALSAEDGAAVGRFLRILHDTPTAEVAELPPPSEQHRSFLAVLDDFRARVLPLLPGDRQPAAAALLDQAAQPTPSVLIHGDLGPAHLLLADGRVTGVIDWGDMCLGDPADDLAWLLNGTSEAFAEALASEYGATPALRDRALTWHRLGPWWEVLAGLDHLGSAYVDSGTAGILDRL